mgnify:CR=1 FL=1
MPVVVDLNIAIEIDENHTGKKVIANDKLKDIISAMNGVILLRMNFQKIYKEENATKGKGEILDGCNANKYMLNSEYYKSFIDNLYIIGDLLNIDRPSGGYSLQLCWTTGYLAGRG